MPSNYDDGLNPGYVLASDGIYAPSGDWGAEQWDVNGAWNEGDLVLNSSPVTAGQSPRMEQITSQVKGKYYGGSYDAGVFVFAEGEWLQIRGCSDE